MTSFPAADFYIGMTEACIDMAVRLFKKAKRRMTGEATPRPLMLSLMRKQEVLNETLASANISEAPQIEISRSRSVKRRLNFSDSDGDDTYFITPQTDGSITVQAPSDGRTFVLPKNQVIKNVVDAVTFIYGFDTSTLTDNNLDDLFSPDLDEDTYEPSLSNTLITSGVDESVPAPYLHFKPGLSSTPGGVDTLFRPSARSTPKPTGSRLIEVIRKPDMTYRVQRVGESDPKRSFVVPHNDRINSPVKAAAFVFGGQLDRAHDVSDPSEGGNRTFVAQKPDGSFVRAPALKRRKLN